MDMLVNLYRLPPKKTIQQVKIARVLPPDLKKTQDMVLQTFGDGWASECMPALLRQPSTCYAASVDGRIIGFACYDATAPGYFGPVGLIPEMRGKGIGSALLLETLHGMKEAGYGYAVIGWCDDAMDFYAKTVGAIPIPGSEPEHTVYSRMLRF